MKKVLPFAAVLILLVTACDSLTGPSGCHFQNCTELRRVHRDGVPRGHCAYRTELDRDNDGHACETSADQGGG
ncbi:MAG: excalibur calcium-binding domain-containing protein [Holophagales bacterium]|nr:excalibur calcium-binding domain-containing protein [Holophagales bacterium]MYD21679.1 excalibur calcium-binding domain-containing protein [Holophagales bacterium]MYI32124.1 excalibur calcium-binding domain-containing protein [Holophagales bacterium]